jgi:hypothetical protein
VATAVVRCFGAHTAKVTLKPSKALKRKLAAWRKRNTGPSSLKLTVTVKMTDLGHPTQTLKQGVTVRR